MTILQAGEAESSPKWVLVTLSAVALLVLVGVAAALVIPLQPQLPKTLSCSTGLACVIMPTNAALDNFDPVNMTVVLGVNSTVQWTNKDSVAHTVVVCPVGGGQECAPSAALVSSPLLNSGDTFEVTFNSTGTYHYFCSIHPATMKGTILVVAASGQST